MGADEGQALDEVHRILDEDECEQHDDECVADRGDPGVDDDAIVAWAFDPRERVAGAEERGCDEPGRAPTSTAWVALSSP